MASRIVFPLLAGCAGIAVAMIAAYPLMVIEQVIGIRYVWWLIGYLAFMSTAFATAQYTSACSPSFKNGPYFHILYFSIAVSVPLLVVYVGLFSEIIAVKLTRYDGPLGGFFAEPEALDSQDRFLFCRSMFYIGALLPLIVIVAFSLIRRCKRGMGLRSETRVL